MYNTYYPYNNRAMMSNNSNNRIIGGGFLGPFILGGITGGLVAPFFGPGPNYGRPNNYYNNSYYYPPYPPYPPYYYRPY